MILIIDIYRYTETDIVQIYHIDTISVIRYQYDIGRHPDIPLHIGPILGQLCKAEIRPILKSDIVPILK